MRSPHFAIVFVLALACRSSSAPAEPGVARDQYCPTRAATLCEQRASCCDTAGIAFDRDTCLSTSTAACEASAKSAEDRGAVYDGVAAEQCLAHVGEGVVACAPTDVDPSYVCAAVFTGTRELGEACSDTSECKGRLDAFVQCLGPDGARTCRLQHLHAIGETCDPTQGGTCGVDAYCAADTANLYESVCTAKGKEGEPCRLENSQHCVHGLFCAGGTCKPPGAVGAKCDPSVEGSCASPNHCDAKTSTCKPPLGLGDNCIIAGTYPYHPEDPCGPDAYCAGSRCVPRLPVGAACSPVAKCHGNCVDGTCEPADTFVSPRSCGAT